ncbi:MAG: hypothetical protein PHD43_04425 [Methylococcales bacterium]|nr:hypothetical protein [Methylococcales bacterium]
MNEKAMSRSFSLASKVVFAALQILKERGGEAPGKEVIAEVEKRVEFDDWAKQTYEKTGYVRWKSMLHFFPLIASRQAIS